MANNILIVDDEAEILDLIDEFLSMEGFNVQKASSGNDAIEILQNYEIELVITDIRMPGMDGLELLDWIKKNDQRTEVIIMTGHASIATAVIALKNSGAYNYFTKPLENIEDLVISAKNALEKRNIQIEKNELMQQLKLQNIELEQRVKERTAKLEITNDKLKNEIQLRIKNAGILQEAIETAETADKIKSDFLHSISHELRTPLNAIIGFSSIIKTTHSDFLSDTLNKYIDIINESGEHLLKIISDIFDLVEMNNNQDDLYLQNIPIFSCLEQYIIQKNNEVPTRIFKLDFDSTIPKDDFVVKADAEKLETLLSNLMSNAIKFSEKDSLIKVGVQQDTNAVIISVSDKGIGIEPKEIKNIFMDFFQIQGGLVGKTPGAGVGLCVAKRIAEKHGWEITAESDGLGKGASFYVRIPDLSDK